MNEVPSGELDAVPVGHPYRAEIEAERRRWYQMLALVRSLTPQECLVPGYYSDPEWSVRDVVAHLGTWLAEAQVQFARMGAGTYEPHEVDIDALNAALLERMAGQPWEVAWLQANAARTMMLQQWYALGDPSAEAGWWIDKAAAAHFAEHLGRLKEWVDELVARRSGGRTESRTTEA